MSRSQSRRSSHNQPRCGVALKEVQEVRAAREERLSDSALTRSGGRPLGRFSSPKTVGGEGEDLQPRPLLGHPGGFSRTPRQDGLPCRETGPQRLLRGELEVQDNGADVRENDRWDG